MVGREWGGGLAGQGIGEYNISLRSIPPTVIKDVWIDDDI